MVNDLERPVFEKHLLLPVIKSWLLSQPETEAAMMSGSGATMFAVLTEGCDVELLKARAKAYFGADTWVCSTSTWTA
jgi:4-diphosphocytidyl-2-C-methyl-D-erythritol kinase